MRPGLFIARKILSKNKENFSRPIVNLAVAAIALGMSVMVVSVAILTGFRQQIRDKVSGFSGHIQIIPYSTNKSLESPPLFKYQPFYPSLGKQKGISHIQVFATKAGIIKTDKDIQGVVFKGIGRDYDWSFFDSHLKSGKILQISDSGRCDQVLISNLISQKLRLKAGDNVRMFFVINNQPRGRKFTIAGIYETGLEEFDNTYVIGDIYHIQKLNNWGADSVGGFEIYVKNFSDITKLGKQTNQNIPVQTEAVTLRNLYPQIFDWLDLQDTNVIIILTLMALVSAITMVSTLLILILEKTNMIGILKALGAQNRLIHRIFLYKALYIIGKGMFWGNIAAIGICWLQLHFGFIKLPQESYYMSVVPIQLEVLPIVGINVATLLICMLIMLIPSHIVSRIQPVKAIRWE